MRRQWGAINRFGKQPKGMETMAGFDFGIGVIGRVWRPSKGRRPSN